MEKNTVKNRGEIKRRLLKTTLLNNFIVFKLDRFEVLKRLPKIRQEVKESNI